MRFVSPLRLFRRAAPPVHTPEPADLGTAFGMEASLEDAPFDNRPAADYPLESQQQAHPAAPSNESPLAWLSGRRRS
ncbi:hypothetical protein ACG0Z6_06520 [Roseateles sp. BYS180W]|uniref:Uncharacterized protein n=1 Tax=Roseateles rivi TaxID=3299028 RepID=A0ABW7FU95_9BURK